MGWRLSVLRSSLVVAFAWLLPYAGCTRGAPQKPLRAETFGAAARELRIEDIAAAAPYTVIVFTSSHCACLRAHDGRLRELAEAYGSRGVQFLGVDSEVGATSGSVEQDARSHGLPFPIKVDPSAQLAQRLGAEYATYTVVVDPTGRIHYRGGIDSDKAKLHENSVPYLRNALDDLLAHREVRLPETKALGCVLRRW